MNCRPRSRRGSVFSRRFALIVAAVLVLVGAAGLVASASDEDAFMCFRHEAGAPVIAEFEIPDGAAIRRHLPLFGKAPELEEMQGPLHVLVFEGEHQAVPVYMPLQPDGAPDLTFTNVVCVVTPSGNETYYYDIDLAGLRP